MLQARTSEHRDEVLRLMEGVRCDVRDKNNIRIHGVVSYDTLASIVDYLRKDAYERRRKARMAGIKSQIDGLWVGDDKIFMSEADIFQVKSFLSKISQYGYDMKELLDEYYAKGWITI